MLIYAKLSYMPGTKIRPKQMNENKKIGMRIMVGALTHLLYCVYPVLEKQSYD